MLKTVLHRELKTVRLAKATFFILCRCFFFFFLIIIVTASPVQGLWISVLGFARERKWGKKARNEETERRIHTEITKNKIRNF